MGDNNIWFTADTHFGHSNIIEYCRRPFKTIQEHDKTLIDNWNEMVKEDDLVYHLGDFTLKGLQAFNEYVEQLNGNIVIIPGSHDHRWMRDMCSVDDWDTKVRLANDIITLEYDKIGERYYRPYSQLIVLCHYAMRVWDRSHYGAWHFYGHSHGRLNAYGLSLDVGVDSFAYYPVHITEIAGLIHNRIDAGAQNYNQIKKRK